MRVSLALYLLRFGGWLLNRAAAPVGMGLSVVLIYDAEDGDGFDVLDITRTYGECREVAA